MGHASPFDWPLSCLGEACFGPQLLVLATSAFHQNEEPHQLLQTLTHLNISSNLEAHEIFSSHIDSVAKGRQVCPHTAGKEIEVCQG